ncbi:sulfatase [Flammeovirga pacifica]|uniref:Sulfatase N-terminal domain-containing protein n=1 Tax=Flammeovirga pacifica TaxID=915059 RepID=A0A1S1YST8_FLAPC|nr:sulfatase [Flammeovirga pacifica]OHX64066.1 hypothetical protein NH26_20885 [Flammeovirga pacifica]
MKNLIIGSLFLLVHFSYAQNKQPNIVFILADDLGINALGSYGNEYVETPHIDQLASEGMLFSNGYATDPTCAPSRAAIMTGQYVPRQGIYRVSDRFKKDKKTLYNMRYLPPENNRPTHKGVGLSLDKILIPEMLKQKGYATAGFGKWHLGINELSMNNQGFDEAIETKSHFNFSQHPTQKDVLENEFNADYTTRKGIDFMTRKVKENKPFFLFLPYYLVHKPLEPKPETLQYFKNKYKLDEEALKVLSMITNLDESVGEVLNAIENLGIGDNTLIIFTSDNGHYKTDNGMFNKPYQGFKGSTLEGGIRIPYIFKYPKVIPANTKATEPIIQVDIYPTLMSFTDIKKVNQPLDGESLYPILTNKKKELKDRVLVWQYTNYSGYNIKKKTFRSEWVNVIQHKGFKMTEYVERDEYILFNLNTDPYETKEVSSKYPEKITELKGLLNQWKQNTQSKTPIKNPDFGKSLK